MLLTFIVYKLQKLIMSLLFIWFSHESLIRIWACPYQEFQLCPSITAGYFLAPTWRALPIFQRSGQFHQHFICIFAPIFFRQKKFKPKMEVQKSFTQNFRTKKPRVKCWWNWHLVCFKSNTTELFLARTKLSLPPLKYSKSDLSVTLILISFQVPEFLSRRPDFLRERDPYTTHSLYGDFADSYPCLVTFLFCFRFR
jgi:hypothetical protein